MNKKIKHIIGVLDQKHGYLSTVTQLQVAIKEASFIYTYISLLQILF